MKNQLFNETKEERIRKIVKTKRPIDKNLLDTEHRIAVETKKKFLKFEEQFNDVLDLMEKMKIMVEPDENIVDSIKKAVYPSKIEM